MIIGNVIGNIWATKKDSGLNGLKLLIVEPFNVKNNQKQTPIVAADIVGAGIGDRVMVIYGGAARHVAGNSSGYAIDAVIVGIIDDLEVNNKEN
ncbi:MAG: EutN/CcmL family microcompartment protein [Brevinemataceae bacterium]